MKFGSVCSGIEAASVAWHPLGWRAAWLSEIEPFPSAVLAHHYPDVPNLGDMTALPARIRNGEIEAPDIFCGGTPCQAFSVAGMRRSLDDARGNLSLTFCEIANEIDTARNVRGLQPAIIFWENVPGVLSTKDNAFGCFLAGLAGEDDPLVPPGDKWTNAGCVYGPTRAVAWRVLDAQYFGVAQRRRRVFVVASARADFDPVAVLFEFDGVRRDSAPSREAGKVAPTIPARSTGGGGLGTDFDCDGGIVGTIGCNTGPNGHGFGDSLNNQAVDAGEDGTGRGTPLVPVTFRADAMREGLAKTPSADAEGRVRLRDPGMGMYVDIAPTLDCGLAHGVAHPVGVTIHGTDPTVRKVASYDEVAQCLRARTPGNIDNSSTTVVQQPVAFDTTQITSPGNVSNPKPGDPCHPLAAGAHPPAIAFHPTQDSITSEDGSTHALGCGSSGGCATVAAAQPYTLAIRGRGDSHNLEYRQDGTANALLTPNGGRGGIGVGAVAFDTYNQTVTGDTAQTLCSRGDSPGGNAHLVPAVQTAMQVRRLTPVECERLQGFPDDYTAIPWRKKPAGECPDGPRYKALGNSWAVPNVRWIGQRIDAALRKHANDNIPPPATEVAS